MKKRAIVFFILLLVIISSDLFSQDFTVTSPEYILLEMNNAYMEGSQVNYGIVSACIAALMEQGNVYSYPALFSVLTAGYPEIIAQEAAGALDVISGDLNLFLLNIIENNPPGEKFIAFRTGMNSRKLTIAEKGQLAELALEISFVYTENNVDLDAMRYAAILALTELNWKRANPLAIRNYYRIQADYMQELVSKDRLIEAILCLGAVGDSDAALILILQLGLINIRAEQTGDFDSEITMAIVKALGNIGDNAAFDHLLFTSNLSYNEDIIAAATEAIARLKW